MTEGKERYARLAARLLIEQQAESPPVKTDEHRDAVVAAMALAIAAKARRRRIVAATAVVLAAAASVLVVLRMAGSSGLPSTKAGAAPALVVEQETGRGNLLVRATSTQPLPDLAVLAVGDSVRSDEASSTTLGFGNGTRVTLSSSGHLRVDEIGSARRFSLFSGRLQAHVAKLAQGERFVVSTPDSEIEVRGTVFSVAVEGPASTCRASASTSTVQVSEGAVWVRSRGAQVLLHPGETWTTPCESSPASSTPPAAEHGQVPRPTAVSVRPAVHKAIPARAGTLPSPVESSSSAPVTPPARAASPTLPVSHLAEQNDLFSAAMAAERQGEHGTALRMLDQLIERFPGGPLGESARAERQRILSVQPPRR